MPEVMKAGVWISAFEMLLVTQAISQELPRGFDVAGLDSAGSPRINVVGIGLERNLNTFNWTGRALVDTSAMGTIVKMTEQYTSNIILLGSPTSPLRRTGTTRGSSGAQDSLVQSPRVFSSNQLRSDQQNVSLLLGRPLTKTLLSEVVWSSLVYSDNKSVGLGHSSFHSVVGGVQYSPLEFLALNPLVGYRWDNQAGVKDKGLSYTLALRTDSINMDGYQLEGKAQFHEDRLNPRLLQRHTARMGVQKYFVGSTRDSLEVAYSRNRSELYDLTVGNIESRGENILSFANLLDYEFDLHFTTSLFVKVTDRSLEKDIRHYSAIPDPTPRFNTTLDEFRLETYYQLTYKSEDGGVLASARIGHDERNEQHAAINIPNALPGIDFTTQDDAEKSKDNLTRRTSLSGSLRLPLSSSDTLSVSGASSILRYDTPGDLIAEARVDRDELLIALSVSTVHRMSRYLDLGITLDGNLNHIVYLFSAWSGNNSYNRVLRLSPVTTFRPVRNIVSSNVFEVLANYTVYDYEQLVSDVHSYSYRQFGWMDSSSIEFSPRIGLDFFSQLKLYERGQLKWSDFSERTENSFVDRTISSQMRFSPQGGLMFAVGVRYFSQSRYAFETGVKTPDSFIRSFGPTCLIVWEVGLHSRIMFKGWYERRTFSGSQTQAAELTQALPNLTMNIAINL